MSHERHSNMLPIDGALDLSAPNRGRSSQLCAASTCEAYQAHPRSERTISGSDELRIAWQTTDAAMPPVIQRSDPTTRPQSISSGFMMRSLRGVWSPSLEK